MGLHASLDDTEDLVVSKDGPVVNNGWALYLRLRPARHGRFYTELSEVLKEGEFLPESMAAVVADELRVAAALRELGLDDDRSWDGVGQRLLMPLPSNQDQERIATQLASARGVTVQGPPGTGKSHTIVNLVSHLIAHGKRVLVTAQNEQALSVLRDKFPEELRDLTVSVLGSTPAAMDQLRSSVQVITDIAARTDESKETAILAELGTQIDRGREDLRRTELKLIDALRDESREYALPGGTVRAAEVSIWLSQTSSQLGKIPDRITANDICPLSNAEARDLYELVRTLDPSDVDAFATNLPRSTDLPTGIELAEESSKVLALQDLVSRLEDSGLNLKAVDKASEAELEDLASQCELAAKRLDGLGEAWVVKTRTLAGSSKEARDFWQNQADDLAKQLANCHELRRTQIGHEFSVPQGDYRDQLRLLDELEERFKSGRGVPRLGNAALRQFHAACRLDGLPLARPDEVKLVKIFVQLRSEQTHLHRRLVHLADENGMPVAPIGPGFLSASDETLRLLHDGLDWEAGGKAQLVSLLSPYLSRSETAGSSEGLREAARSLRSAVARHQERALTAKRKELQQSLVKSASASGASPIWARLREALQAQDWAAWRTTLQESKRLLDLGMSIARCQELEKRVGAKAPLWLAQLKLSRAAVDVCGDFEDFTSMWAWSQADGWLKELHARADVESLMATSIAQQDAISRLVLQYAERAAAVAVKTNLTDTKRRSLTAWLQALAKRGKGTGKMAPYWENEARKSLPEAMGAIPVWIMPIHRVIENFDPRKSDLFDVVIVDESSQCDLLSVGVLALGRKTVVVGDDKQTSPSGVGIERDRIISLQNIYIPDVSGKALLTVDESLYGIAERVFPSVILLSEHFRCLPEIINFSNRYYDNRILPLREKPPRDLGPVLNAVRVEDGACTGSDSKRINTAEAVALVEQIVECCQDPAYDGLSFGVVTLQGNTQAPLIEKMLMDRLGLEEFQRRNLRVGNPAAFQGDERSVMFISVVADDNRYKAVGTADKQRVNVAASRAQDQLWVFYSVDPGTLHADDQRRALMTYVLDGGVATEPTTDQRDLCESKFEVDVLTQIVSRGYRVTPQHKVGGYRIDLVVEGSAGRLAVECDGDSFHGPDQWESDIRRQRTLERLGWNFWRVRASEYYRDPEQALNSLWDRLEGRNWISGGQARVSVAVPESIAEIESEDSSTDDFDEVDQLVSSDDIAQDPEDEDDSDNWDDDSEEDSEDDADEWDEEYSDELELAADDDEREGLFGNSELGLPTQGSLQVGHSGSQVRDWFAFMGGEPEIPLGDSWGIWQRDEKAQKVLGVPMEARGRTEVQSGRRVHFTAGIANVRIELAYTEWEDGSGQVDCVGQDGAGRNLARLLRGGRLGVYETGAKGEKFCELRIMRMNAKGSATAQNPAEGEFEQILGWPLEEQLLEWYPDAEIGDREELLGDESPRRYTPIVIWDGRDQTLPVFIYAATRVMPLMQLDGMLG